MGQGSMLWNGGCARQLGMCYWLGAILWGRMLCYEVGSCYGAQGCAVGGVCYGARDHAIGQGAVLWGGIPPYGSESTAAWCTYPVHRVPADTRRGARGQRRHGGTGWRRTW